MRLKYRQGFLTCGDELKISTSALHPQGKKAKSTVILVLVENVLARAFKVEKPNQKWVTDITYIPTTQGCLYLAVVLDLFSSMIVGWAFSSSLETKLVLNALESARRKRKPSAEGGLLHHSDRGVQYASLEYR